MRDLLDQRRIADKAHVSSDMTHVSSLDQRRIADKAHVSSDMTHVSSLDQRRISDKALVHHAEGPAGRRLF